MTQWSRFNRTVASLAVALSVVPALFGDSIGPGPNAGGSSDDDGSPYRFRFVDPTTGERIISRFDVTDAPYLAAGDGEADDTDAFARALLDAKTVGGGTVSVPPGRYRITAPLRIPDSVTLRGDVSGSTIQAEWGVGCPAAEPLISLGNASAVMGLAVWYPEQQWEAPVPTALTIGEAGFVTTISDVVFVNTYRAIDVGMVHGSGHQIDRVRGTVLREGIRIDNNWEITDITRIHFSPEYWQRSRLPGSPQTDEEVDDLIAILRRQFVGVIVGKADDIFLYDIDIDPSQSRSGIRLVQGPPGPEMIRNSYGTMIGLYDTLVDVEVMSPIGYTVADDVPGGCDLDYVPPPARQPVSDALFDICSPPFVAVGDGIADDTAALLDAIDAAGRDGGTVFLPPGMYRITQPVVVPSGVEVRGIYDHLHHATSVPGSQVLVDHGAGAADGSPAISLSAGSGLHGLTIRYADQTIDSPAAFPPTIRGLGADVWVEYVTVINGFQLLDLGTHRCDRFLVRGFRGTALDVGIAVGGGSVGGVLEATMVSYGVWLESPYRIGERDAFQRALSAYTSRRTTGMVIGESTGLRGFSNFVFDVRVGFRFGDSSGPGGGPREATFWRMGSDTARRYGIDFSAGTDVTVVGLNTGGASRWVYARDTAEGPLTLLGRRAWGPAFDRVENPDSVREARAFDSLAVDGSVNVAKNARVRIGGPVVAGAESYRVVDGDRLTGVTIVSDFGTIDTPTPSGVPGGADSVDGTESAAHRLSANRPADRPVSIDVTWGTPTPVGAVRVRAGFVVDGDGVPVVLRLRDRNGSEHVYDLPPDLAVRGRVFSLPAPIDGTMATVELPASVSSVEEIAVYALPTPASTEVHE